MELLLSKLGPQGKRARGSRKEKAQRVEAQKGNRPGWQVAQGLTS